MPKHCLSADGTTCLSFSPGGAESLVQEDGKAVAEKEHARDSGKGGVPGGSGPQSEGAGGFEFAVCVERQSPEVSLQAEA